MVGDQPDGPAVRASDAEREAAIERLRTGAADGRLTFQELADRVEVAVNVPAQPPEPAASG
jgi:hypothetical protein